MPCPEEEPSCSAYNEAGFHGEEEAGGGSWAGESSRRMKGMAELGEYGSGAYILWLALWECECEMTWLSSSESGAEDQEPRSVAEPWKKNGRGGDRARACDAALLPVVEVRRCCLERRRGEDTWAWAWAWPSSELFRDMV